jgi:hypothetical protein
MRKAPTKSVMVIRTCDIEGIPKVRAMAQWIPYRGRCWWTGKALAARGGVQPNRTTGRFIRRLPNGWELQVLSRNLQPRRLDTALGIENKRYRMPDADQWSSYYKEAPDGRRRITSAALMALGIKYPDRVLDADLWGKPAKVVLLDVPHKVAGRVDSDPPQYLLKRLRLHDLPGCPRAWHPWRTSRRSLRSWTAPFARRRSIRGTAPARSRLSWSWGLNGRRSAPGSRDARFR